MQVPTFFPDEFGEWVAAAVTTVALIGAIYRGGQSSRDTKADLAAIRNDLKVGLHDQGERIGRVEEGCAANKAELEARTAQEAVHTMEVGTNTRELSRVSANLNGLTRAIRRLERELGRKDTEMRERVVALETQNEMRGP